MLVNHRLKKLSKHDRYVLELKQKLKGRYDIISTNVRIFSKKRSLGEIDLIGKKGKCIDLYEVKCSHRIVKAKKQLNRAKRLLKLGDANGYFYCGSSGTILGI
jgi:Holliday junction resolvase-like predicted endonuclease